jgi:hypothetical protein
MLCPCAYSLFVKVKDIKAKYCADPVTQATYLKDLSYTSAALLLPIDALTKEMRSLQAMQTMKNKMK